MSQWHGGKGSGQRKGADQKKYADNWDAIFGKKEKEAEKDLKFTTAGEYMKDLENDSEHK